MTGAYVNHEDIRQFLAKLGTEKIGDGLDPLRGLEHVASCFGLSFPELNFRCKATGPASLTGIPLSRDTMFALGDMVTQRDMSVLKNTKRLDLVANAFGWKADAFMHHLKTTTSGLGRNETMSPGYDGIPKMTIRDLDSGPSVHMMLDSLNQHSDGLFLFAGPTGSGKSTTLQMTVRSISKDKTVTIIEDLESIRTPSIRLNEISQVLHRSPPDILVMPEIRDEKSARFALRMAKNMVVLATIHGGSPLSVVKRLAHMAAGVKIDGLRGVFSQRLVRTVPEDSRFRLAICHYEPFEWEAAHLCAREPLPEDHMDVLYLDAELKIRRGETTIKDACAEFGREFAAYMAARKEAHGRTSKRTVVREIPHKNLAPFGTLKFSGEWPVEDADLKS